MPLKRPLVSCSPRYGLEGLVEEVVVDQGKGRVCAPRQSPPPGGEAEHAAKHRRREYLCEFGQGISICCRGVGGWCKGWLGLWGASVMGLL